VHFPDLGAETVTDLAVIVPFFDEPVTVRHLPTLTDDRVTLTVWENDVVAVQLTVV
jgi:hypothetical protein